ncbi:HAD hydrolase, IA, variant 3 family protein [Chlamydia ibidis]|uniref:HAD hydrolase, IA, variant 3 family protein n=2 Tax=Chlamydia ibidis TaxID=1405396 RepID=S7KLW7_9CHLA|nr:HAD family phosphatase [Chlamydia ibidis]EPP35435.1 HAD hydrolase, IA, variant 3 family protein [Chlamydia ibidis]EQM62834.1 HAD hydrolase, IA, variant 3 family protein [Chlamydia ibidis 10-1398/6]
MQIDQFDVFLFDLDGLVLNTEPIFYRAFLEAWESYSVPLSMDFCTYYHLSMLGREKFQECVIEDFPASKGFFPKCFEDRERLYRNLVNEVVPELMPGIETFLKCLISKNKICGVVTNSSKEVTTRFLSKIPTLELFHFWVTREDYPRSKPYPDSYQYAYRTFVRQEQKVVGFEDSIKGLRALSKIPATMVAINPMMSLTTHSHPDFEGKNFHYFPSFCELCPQHEEQNQL